MRGLTTQIHGAPDEVLELVGDLADPCPADDEVVIEVEACALNFADALVCRGTYQRSPAPPFTPGFEVSGKVVDAGTLAGHAVGDHVTGLASLPHGGLAERCIARSVDVFATHDRTAPAVAAASHITYQTAWFALVRRARLEAGETLVVNAAAGGAGSAAVQLGHALGSRVIAVASGEHKVSTCLKLGASIAIDRSRQDVVEEVMSATSSKGADVVFDPVGSSGFEAATHLVAWEGRIVVIGAASGRYAQLATNHPMVKNYSVIGLNWTSYPDKRPDLVSEAHQALVALRADFDLSPLVSEVVGLEGAVDALGRLTSGATTGKIVITPSRTATPLA